MNIPPSPLSDYATNRHIMTLVLADTVAELAERHAEHSATMPYLTRCLSDYRVFLQSELAQCEAALHRVLDAVDAMADSV